MQEHEDPHRMKTPFVPRAFPHSQLMGARYLGFDEQTQTITMRFCAPDSFITPRGSVQGGLVAGFLDEAMGWAFTCSSGGSHSPLMLDVSYSLLRPVPRGELVATGRVVRAGRRVLFLEAELFAPADAGAKDDARAGDLGEVDLSAMTLVARGTSTAIPTPNPGS